MVLKKGFEDAQQILEPIEEYWWDVFTEEIFHRLPANQLQTMKGVCRNWFRTISSPNFVGFHLKIYNESRIRVVVKNGGRVVEYKFNINSSDSQETKQLPCPPAIRSSNRSTLLGSCDGLLCLHFEGSRPSVVVYNPSTGKYFTPKSTLKDTNYGISCSWFGHHPCSAEYVLVLGSYCSEIGVYKFNCTSNFELIHSTPCSVDPHVYFTFYARVGTLLHGAIHWPTQRNLRHSNRLCRRVIYAYHLDDNKYFEITPPVQQLLDFKLGVAQGYLFAILRHKSAQLSFEFEMWIMKEYGVQQSWTKYANIHGFNIYNELSPLGFSPNGDLILDVDRYMLIKYSFNDNKAKLLAHHEYGNAVMCADSLVSPKIVGT